MATETEIEVLKTIIKASGANIKVTDFGCSVEDAAEYPDQDLVLIEMANHKRSKVLVTPAHNAHLKAYGDKKFRQIVLNVREPAREITRRVPVSIYPSAVNQSEKTFLKQGKEILEKGGNFNLNLPAGTTYEVVGEITSNQSMTSAATQRRYFEADVKATVPASNIHFLIGHDENAMFVCVLPKPVKSVARAHEVLRPKGVPKDALRQGEFFFIPANARVSRILDDRVLNNVDAIAYGSSDGEWLDDGETHAAQTVLHFNSDSYALGWIADNEKRHVALFLSEWHKVVHNLEIAPPPHMENADAWD